jgi:predicted Zn-dependent peptidase
VSRLTAAADPACIIAPVLTDAPVLAGLARDGVTGGELARAKRYLIGLMPRLLKANAGIVKFLQTINQFDLELDFDRRLPELVEAVTVAEVTGQTLVAERTAIAVTGPYEAS